MKTITGIHGVPRSGTSWLAQIFNASPDVALKFQPLFSYAFKDYIKEKSHSSEITGFFNNIYNSEDYFINMKDNAIHKNYPEFKKKDNLNHLVFKHVRYHNLIETFLENNKNIKFILVLRNPFSVLSSWKNAPREFNPEWKFNDEWYYAERKNKNRVEEYFGYSKWKEAMNLFMTIEEKYKDRVTTVIYKELLFNTIEESKRLFAFAEIPFSRQVLNFIEESKRIDIDDKNSVYRNKSNDDTWKNNITLKIQKVIKDDLKNTRLEKYLY